jgi:hypothetical protein
MHHIGISLLIFAVGLLCGCGSAPEPKFSAPPHGGNVIELRDGGYVELKTEREALSSKGARGALVKARIEAYFFQSDGTSAMSPAPTDVKVTLGAEGGGTVVNLIPQSEVPGKFASQPGDYLDELRGQIDFQLNGKPAQAKFSFR